MIAKRGKTISEQITGTDVTMRLSLSSLLVHLHGLQGRGGRSKSNFMGSRSSTTASTKENNFGHSSNHL